MNRHAKVIADILRWDITTGGTCEILCAASIARRFAHCAAHTDPFFDTIKWFNACGLYDDGYSVWAQANSNVEAQQDV